MRSLIGSLVVAATLALGSAPAAEAAPIISFAGNGGLLGTSASFGGVTATGLYLSAGGLNPARLFQRNDAPDDLGLGVCSPLDLAGVGQLPNGSGCGAGERNEIDNNGWPLSADAILLDFGAAATVTALWLSSLDAADDALVVASDALSLSLSDYTLVYRGDGGDTPGNDVVNPRIAITGAAQSMRYFIVAPGSVGLNDDFLLWGADVAAAVPEPATLALLGSGLLALALGRRRRRR